MDPAYARGYGQLYAWRPSISRSRRIGPAYQLSRIEQRAFTRHPLPFGSSLLAVGGHAARA